eukprot:scaffold26800_cov127-Cylindrotheca_fusiformis.AAC.2
MGIPDFLSKVLETAGRTIDLRDYAKNRREKRRNKRQRQRRLRIGIDITSWVYKAAHGFGDKLGDGRFLTNYGRAELLKEQGPAVDNEENIAEYVSACTTYVMKRLETLRDEGDAELLVVLDGDTPPIKAKEVERRRKVRNEHVRNRDEPLDPNENNIVAANEKRTKANRRAGAGRHLTRIIHELIKCLRKSQISFLVAPYEADSQLAYLSKVELIDLIVTEDSDLVAYGARAVLYKSVAEIGKGRPRGTLLQYEAIGAVSGTLDFSDFTPVMMAVLFVCLGCDYCEKLKGIGIQTAARIVRNAFLKHSDSAISVVLAQLYDQCYQKKFSEDQKREYEERFLSALFMYQHPIVYDPLRGKAVMQKGGDLKGQSVLLKHKAYAKLCKDKDRIRQIVGVRKDPEAATAAASAVGIGDAPESEKEDQVQEESDKTEGAMPESHNLLTQEPLDCNHLDDYNRGVKGRGLTNGMALPEVEQPQVEIEDLDTENYHALETQPMSIQQSISLPGRASFKENDEFDASESENLNTQMESPAPQQRRSGSERRFGEDSNMEGRVNVCIGEHHETLMELPISDNNENRGDTENQEIRSPNLLYSSTPEKTSGSQGDQSVSAPSGSGSHSL